MTKKRGSLIVIEGPDGSGKQIQTKLLIDRLKEEGIPVKHISFPRYNTPTGRVVGGPLLGKPEIGESWFGDPDKVDPLIASGYYAIDRGYAVAEMNDILNSGTHLISDRYYQSNMAHQGGKIKDEGERRKFFEKIGKLELDVFELPREDRVIFLYIPTEVAFELLKKRGLRDGHELNRNHLIRAEQVYESLASRDITWEQINCAPDGTINSLRTPEDIHEEVYIIAKKTIDWKMGKGEYYFKNP